MARSSVTVERKEKILDLVQMRIDGYTFQEIADKYGVSRQYIHQELSAIVGNAKPRQKGIDEKIIYPNLAKWIFENRIPKYKLSEIVGMKSKSTEGIRQKLYGKRNFSITEIKKLLEVTGETFEYLFAERKGQEDKIVALVDGEG